MGTRKKKRTAVAKRKQRPSPTKVQPVDVEAQTLSNIIIKGDISSLSPAEKINYYKAFCAYVGLNPITQPFAILKTRAKEGNEWVDKEVLYAKKEATEQLRTKHGISVIDLHGELVGGVVYRVIAKGQNAQGRIDTASGAVSVKGLTGDNLANAIMKCETKAKRRLTLSLSGLGMLDEAEMETIPDAQLLPAPVKPTQLTSDTQIQPDEPIDPDHDPRPQQETVQTVEGQQPKPTKTAFYSPEKAERLKTFRIMLDNALTEGLLTGEEISEAKREWNLAKSMPDVNLIYKKYQDMVDKRWSEKEAKPMSEDHPRQEAKP